jgi:hypothetical protein
MYIFVRTANYNLTPMEVHPKLQSSELQSYVSSNGDVIVLFDASICFFDFFLHYSKLRNQHQISAGSYMVRIANTDSIGRHAQAVAAFPCQSLPAHLHLPLYQQKVTFTITLSYRIPFLVGFIKVSL